MYFNNQSHSSGINESFRPKIVQSILFFLLICVCVVCTTTHASTLSTSLSEPDWKSRLFGGANPLAAEPSLPTSTPSTTELDASFNTEMTDPTSGGSEQPTQQSQENLLGPVTEDSIDTNSVSLPALPHFPQFGNVVKKTEDEMLLGDGQPLDWWSIQKRKKQEEEERKRQEAIQREIDHKRQVLQQAREAAAKHEKLKQQQKQQQQQQQQHVIHDNSPQGRAAARRQRNMAGRQQQRQQQRQQRRGGAPAAAAAVNHANGPQPQPFIPAPEFPSAPSPYDAVEKVHASRAKAEEDLERRLAREKFRLGYVAQKDLTVVPRLQLRFMAHFIKDAGVNGSWTYDSVTKRMQIEYHHQPDSRFELHSRNPWRIVYYLDFAHLPPLLYRYEVDDVLGQESSVINHCMYVSLKAPWDVFFSTDAWTRLGEPVVDISGAAAFGAGKFVSIQGQAQVEPKPFHVLYRASEDGSIKRIEIGAYTYNFLYQPHIDATHWDFHQLLKNPYFRRMAPPESICPSEGTITADLVRRFQQDFPFPLGMS